jgi:hypothetical protein
MRRSYSSSSSNSAGVSEHWPGPTIGEGEDEEWAIDIVGEILKEEKLNE